MAENDRTTGLVGNSAVKVPVRAASTAALTLSGEQTVDGVALVTDDRVLVKDQASSIDNGIYVVDTGSWERAKDADGSYDWYQGSLILVYGGTVNGNKLFKCTAANPIDVDTDAITFQAMSAEFTGSSKTVWCGTATGTANALVLTPATVVATAELQAGLELVFKSGAAGNSAATTIAVSGQAAIAVQSNGVACVGGEIEASKWYRATLDGSGAAFQLEAMNPGRIPQDFVLPGDISPAQITGNQDDYNPTGLSTASVLRLDTDASRNLTGIAGGADGRILVVHNIGSFPLVLVHDATSTAANRFYLPGSANLQVNPNETAILRYDATSSRWRLLQNSNGEYRSSQVFTASGTWTKPAGLKRVRVTVVGGGGSGGGTAATAAGNCTGAQGGGGGGTSIKTIAASSLGATETVTVGTGGAAASAGGAGNAGGTSSFGSHCSATGGPAGATGSGVSGDQPTSSGASVGGIGSGGDFNFRGGTAGEGFAFGGVTQAFSGSGGESFLAGRTRPVFSAGASTSVAGNAYGGGSSGGAAGPSASAGGSSAGGDGIVIVEEFF
jgi:hypothetical protein